MSKSLSFKKVVQASYDALQSLNGKVNSKELDKLSKVYTPHILEHIFNQTTLYPKAENKILEDSMERMNTYINSICSHCGNYKFETGGMATEGLTRRRIKCPFHD